MNVRTAFTIVFASGILFASAGSALGAMLGTLAPDYYRSIIRGGQSPEFNPLQVGVGLGATQGAASGIGISALVLALLAWRDLRSQRSAFGSDFRTTESRVRTWPVHVGWGVGSATAALSSGAIAFILGGILGQQQLYQTWTDRKLDRLAIILQSDEFDGLEAEYSSAAQVYLIGTLPDNATRDVLHKRLGDTFGIEEADEMIWRVDVARLHPPRSTNR